MQYYYVAKKSLSFIFLFFCLPFLSACHPTHSDGIKLLTTHQIDNSLFIQGLEQNKQGNFIYSSGLYGQSEIGILNLKEKKKQQIHSLPSQFFAEGLTQTPYGIWQITWRENTAFLRDPNSLNIIKNAYYLSEGWGIAYDDNRDILWLSDGSHLLQQFDPQHFEKLGEMPIYDQENEVSLLNELEFANGFLYANVWQSNHILKINPMNGNVIKKYDFSFLVEPLDLQNSEAVLNGIAHIEKNRFLITGKLFPVAWEVELN